MKRPKRRARGKTPRFFAERHATGRRDGSVRHDDYIYRRRTKPSRAA